MKTLTKSLNKTVVSVLALGLSSVPGVFAVERPAEMDDLVPTIEQEKVAAQERPKDNVVIEVRPEAELIQAGENVPYLGIGSVPISDLLAGHLGLTYGVTIQRVHKGSGADLAGLKTDDILTIFNGREIKSPLDLRDAVKACKVGQEVMVSVVRRGIKEDIAVTLAERPAGLPRFAPGNAQDVGQIQQIWPNGGLGGPGIDAMEQLQGIMDQLDEAALGLKMTDIIGDKLGNGEEPMDVKLGTQSSVTWSDAEGNINMKMSDGNTVVTIRDRQGNVTFTGPWNTAEDKAAVEPGVRARIENMGISPQGNQLKLWMGPHGR